MDFVAVRYTHVSPLAKKLFSIDGINRVFYGRDYISISKKEDSDWNVFISKSKLNYQTLKPEIFSVITDHFTNH